MSLLQWQVWKATPLHYCCGDGNCRNTGIRLERKSGPVLQILKLSPLLRGGDALGGFLQSVSFVGCFPSEGIFGAAEVAEGGGLLVDRAAQFKRFDHALGRQLEVRANQFGQLLFARTVPVPKVSTMTETGSATPIA